MCAYAVAVAYVYTLFPTNLDSSLTERLTKADGYSLQARLFSGYILSMGRLLDFVDHRAESAVALVGLHWLDFTTAYLTRE